MLEPTEVIGQPWCVVRRMVREAAHPRPARGAALGGMVASGIDRSRLVLVISGRALAVEIGYHVGQPHGR